MKDGLEAAVRDGVIDRATAERLAPYLAGSAPAPEDADPDDEKLRFITGFNDIFVTIGLVMFLGALGYLLSNLGLAISAASIAAAAWGLAEFFTRVRRLALPSIVLLVIFVSAVFITVLALSDTGALSSLWTDDTAPGPVLIGGVAAAFAALLHWYRFHVPITVAAGTAAVAAMLLAICQMVSPGLLDDHPIPIFLSAGAAIFALAMWFDSSDLKRQTRRTDIAFWLHLLAAPMIVHPILMSMVKDTPSAMAAAQVMAVFLILAVVALVVDRRAILVSSLAYLAYAAGTLIQAAGAQSSSFAISTLAVGAVVLMLSAAWRPLRRAFMGLLPQSVRGRLPAVA